MNASFKTLLIYYFSGTGNARNVALWFADEAITRGFRTEVINIAAVSRESIIQPPENTLIGFCSPTHGFNFPAIMLRFLWRFPRAKNPVFIINTRAGMKLYKIPLVGLTGVAQFYAAIVLRIKGYRIVGMR